MEMSRASGNCVICGESLIIVETDYPYVIKTDYVEHKPVCATCFNLWYDGNIQEVGARFMKFLKVRDSTGKVN